MKTTTILNEQTRQQRLDSFLSEINAMTILQFPSVKRYKGTTRAELMRGNNVTFMLMTMYNDKKELENFDFFVTATDGTLTISNYFEQLREKFLEINAEKI